MKLGIYHYHVLRRGSFPAQFDSFKMPVKILGESETQFKVEFVHPHKDGRKVGTTTWVKKKHIRITKGEPKADIASVRLPYKD